MSTYVRKLLDSSNNVICPATRTSAVYSGKTTQATWNTDAISQINSLSTRVTELENIVPVGAALTPKNISNAIAQGTYSQVWSVGDTSAISVGSIQYTVRIIGFDHDADENGNVLPITFEFCQIINTASTDRVYTSGNAYTMCNTIYSNMESDWKAIIKPAKKAICTSSSGTITTFTDELWLLSTAEVGFKSGNEGHSSEGACYSYCSGINSNYKNSKRIKLYNGTAYAWYTRSGILGYGGAHWVDATGASDYDLSSSTAQGISPAFAVGL